MKRKLPPLNALAAFEAAARLLSFRHAGDELCVTPSAISHQVRALEDYLGVKLFERSTRTVELTDVGRRYLHDLGGLLDRLESRSNQVAGRGQRQKTVTLQTTDSFATRWLIPRLAEFESLHADFIVKIVTHDFRAGLRASEADVGILFIGEKQRGAASNNSDMRLLFAEEIFPVCSPGLMRGGGAPSLVNVADFTLLHDDNVGISWADWLAAAGGAQIDSHDGPHYNHAHLALAAAELGHGIALASNVLAGDALDAGRLVAPFADKITIGCGYYLAQSAAAQAREDCRAFCEWVVARAG